MATATILKGNGGWVGGWEEFPEVSAYSQQVSEMPKVSQ